MQIVVLGSIFVNIKSYFCTAKPKKSDASLLHDLIAISDIRKR